MGYCYKNVFLRLLFLPNFKLKTKAFGHMLITVAKIAINFFNKL